MNNRSIVVIGGAGVEKDKDGKFYTRAAIANYLETLSTQIGFVYYFPATTERAEKAQFNSLIQSKFIQVHDLKSKKNRNRFISWIKDVYEIIQCTRKSSAVLEFVPAAKTTPILIFLSTTHIAYFGMDPRKRWQTNKSQSWLTRAKFRMLSLISYLAEKLADVVLVRDETQLERLKQTATNEVYFSKPIIAFTPPTKKYRQEGNLISKGEKKLLFIGKLMKRKGISELLEAVSLLVNHEDLSITNLKLSLVGHPFAGEEGFSYEDIQSQADQLGIADHIELLGYIDDIDQIRQLYQDADVFVLPSRQEGYARVLDEAAIYGLPIVCTSIPEIASVLEHNKHAILVPPKDPQALANGIKTILNNPQHAQYLGEQIFNFVRNKLDESAAEQHTRIIKQKISH